MIYCLVILAASFGFKQSATTALEPYLPFYNYNFNQARPTSLEDGLPSKSQLLTIIQNLLKTVQRLQDTRERRGHGEVFPHSNSLGSVLKRLKTPLPDLNIESPILPLRAERARMPICDFYGCKEGNGFDAKFRTERTRMPICDFYGCKESNSFDTKFNTGRFGLERFLCKKLNQRLDNQHLEAILEDLIKPMYSIKQFGDIPEGVNADSASIKFNFPNHISHVKPRPVLQHSPFMPIPFAFGSFSGPWLEQRKHTTKSPPKVSTLKVRGSSPKVKAKADPLNELAKVDDVIDPSTQAISSTSNTYSSATVRPDIYSSFTVRPDTTTVKSEVDTNAAIPVNSLNDSLSIGQRILSSGLHHNNQNRSSNLITEVPTPHTGKAGVSHLYREKVVTTNTSSSKPDVTMAALEVTLPSEKSNDSRIRSNSKLTGFSDKSVVTSAQAAPVQTLNLAPPAESAAAHEVVDETVEEDIVQETEQKQVVEETDDNNDSLNETLDASKMLSGDVPENGTSFNALKENEQELPLNSLFEATNATEEGKAEQEALQDLHVRRKRESVTELDGKNRFLLKPIQEFLADYHSKLQVLEGEIKAKLEKFFSRRSLPDDI